MACRTNSPSSRLHSARFTLPPVVWVRFNSLEIPHRVHPEKNARSLRPLRMTTNEGLGMPAPSVSPPQRRITKEGATSILTESSTSFVQILDEPLFNYPVDDRVVEKVVDGRLSFVCPIQNRLNDRGLHSRLTVQILDCVLICLVERIAAAEQIFSQNFIGKLFPGSQGGHAFDIGLKHALHRLGRVFVKILLHSNEVHRKRNSQVRQVD